MAHRHSAGLKQLKICYSPAPANMDNNILHWIYVFVNCVEIEHAQLISKSLTDHFHARHSICIRRDITEALAEALSWQPMLPLIDPLRCRVIASGSKMLR